jgi:hypothetical protein
MRPIYWLPIAVLLVGVLAAGTAGNPQDDVARELREMKALLLRMSSIADREAHPRLYPHHVFTAECDMGLVDGKLDEKSICAKVEAENRARKMAADDFWHIFRFPPEGAFPARMEKAVEALAAVAHPEYMAVVRPMAEWWKAGKHETDEWHRKTFKHARGSRCDFSSYCFGQDR